MGIERLLSALPRPLPMPVAARVYVAHLPHFEGEGYRLARDLRAQGFAADSDLLDRSLKAQLKEAGRRATIAVIVGGREWADGLVTVRDLGRAEQETVERNQLANYLRQKIQEDQA
jgi:histidyl-tRNA synthetase